MLPEARRRLEDPGSQPVGARVSRAPSDASLTRVDSQVPSPRARPARRGRGRPKLATARLDAAPPACSGTPARRSMARARQRPPRSAATSALSASGVPIQIGQAPRAADLLSSTTMWRSGRSRWGGARRRRTWGRRWAMANSSFRWTLSTSSAAQDAAGLVSGRVLTAPGRVPGRAGPPRLRVSEPASRMKGRATAEPALAGRQRCDGGPGTRSAICGEPRGQALRRRALSGPGAGGLSVVPVAAPLSAPVVPCIPSAGHRYEK